MDVQTDGAKLTTADAKARLLAFGAECDARRNHSSRALVPILIAAGLGVAASRLMAAPAMPAKHPHRLFTGKRVTGLVSMGLLARFAQWALPLAVKLWHARRESSAGRRGIIGRRSRSASAARDLAVKVSQGTAEGVPKGVAS